MIHVMADSKSHKFMLEVKILIIADKMHDMSFICNVNVFIFRMYHKRKHFIAIVKTKTKNQ